MESVDSGNGDSIVSPGLSVTDIISRHRATLPVGPSSSAFIDQVTFYGGIIDALSTKLQMQSAAADAQFASGSFSDVGHRDAAMFGWVLRSLAALVDCVNHIGAELSGCTASRLLACSSNAFGLRETFVYAHSSYAGDAYFRSFLRTASVLPTTSDKDHRSSSTASSWRQQLTDAFPQLESCRREVLYDPAAVYRGRGSGSVDSPVVGRGGCAHRWTPGSNNVVGQRPGQNQSVAALKATDVDRLVDAETARIRGVFDRSRRELTTDAVSRLVVAACALAASVVYTLFSLVIGPFCSSTASSVGCRSCVGFEGRLRSKYDDEVRSSLPDVNKDNRQNEIDDDDGKILKNLFASSPYPVSPSADVQAIDKFIQCTDV